MTESLKRLAAEVSDCWRNIKPTAPIVPGLSEPGKRLLEAIDAHECERADDNLLHAAAMAVHGALKWGFDPNAVTPDSLARAATELARVVFERDTQLAEALRERDEARGPEWYPHNKGRQIALLKELAGERDHFCNERDTARAELEATRAQAAALRAGLNEALDAIDMVESEPGREGGPMFRVDWTRSMRLLRDTVKAEKIHNAKVRAEAIEEVTKFIEKWAGGVCALSGYVADLAKEK